jgi:hypothetical protein
LGRVLTTTSLGPHELNNNSPLRANPKSAPFFISHNLNPGICFYGGLKKMPTIMPPAISAHQQAKGDSFGQIRIKSLSLHK